MIFGIESLNRRETLKGPRFSIPLKASRDKYDSGTPRGVEEEEKTFQDPGDREGCTDNEYVVDEGGARDTSGGHACRVTRPDVVRTSS